MNWFSNQSILYSYRELANFTHIWKILKLDLLENKASFNDYLFSIYFPFNSSPRISLISFTSWILDYPVYNSSVHLVTHRCLERLVRRRPCARSTSKDTPNANDQFTLSRSAQRRGVNERNSKSRGMTESRDSMRPVARR